jgi:predicted membrane protein DUF2157
MSDRTEAMNEIVALARRHAISSGEIAAAMGGVPEPADHRRRAILIRVLAYLGGTFVFAGIGVFVALQWDGLNSAARVVVTLGTGVSALILALIAFHEERFSRAATPLLLVAAALEPTGMIVSFKEYGSGGDWRWASLITSATMALQFAGVFGRLRRSTPLFQVVVFATLAFWAACDLLELRERTIAIVLGGSLILASVGIDRTGHQDITPPFYFLGAIAFLYGFFDSVERTSFEILFLAVSAGFVYLATVVGSRTLLLVATLAILAYTGYFTGQHFADSIGWPLALIAFGIFMIGLSALAFRIDRTYIKRVR